MSEKIRYHATETVFTYVFLEKAARQALEQGKGATEGSFYNFLLSLLSDALALEAYLNHLGAQLLPYWGEIERPLQPRQKLVLLCHRLQYQLNFGVRPF